ncbi:Hypothetical protein A7982_05747 [Minicystis rosea]|nr:Hypothetical protein A7982_05747 [Minicystis rosea]
MQATYRVLTDETNDDDLRRTAAALGWPLLDDTLSAHEGRLQWASHDGKCVLEYIRDPAIPLPYLRILGEDVAQIAELARVARLILERDEVIDRARAAVEPRAQARAILDAGIAAPRAFDQRFFDIIMAGSRPPHRGVRKAAILAFSYTAWRELEPMLQALATSDPEPDVQDLARLALEQAAQHGWVGKFEPPGDDFEDGG